MFFGESDLYQGVLLRIQMWGLFLLILSTACTHLPPASLAIRSAREQAFEHPTSDSARISFLTLQQLKGHLERNEDSEFVSELAEVKTPLTIEDYAALDTLLDQSTDRGFACSQRMTQTLLDREARISSLRFKENSFKVIQCGNVAAETIRRADLIQQKDLLESALAGIEKLFWVNLVYFQEQIVVAPTTQPNDSSTHHTSNSIPMSAVSLNLFQELGSTFQNLSQIAEAGCRNSSAICSTLDSYRDYQSQLRDVYESSSKTPLESKAPSDDELPTAILRPFLTRSL